MKKRNSKKFSLPLSRKLKRVALTIFFIIVIGLMLIQTIFFITAQLTIDITNNNFWQSKASILMYDREDEYIGTLTENNVQWVDLYTDVDGEKKLNVSEYYLEALIATEDRSFTEHNGVNYKGIFRAVTGVLVNRDTSSGGGSSITMQLAKLLYLQPVDIYSENEEDGVVATYNIAYQDPIRYKLQQIVLAKKIEKMYSKEEILENYINTMYFGSGGWGIYNASDYFYGKEPKDLNIYESATLAGMTQRPTSWNPYTNPEDTKARRDVVINNLLSEKYITQAEAETAINTPIDKNLVDHSNDTDAEISNIAYNSFFDAVNRELKQTLGEDFDYTTGGIKVYTTMDADLQSQTYEILKTENYVDYPDDYQVGTVSMDPQTGEVLAIGNGLEGHESFGGTNYAFTEKRQSGSSIKPVLDYAPAIEYLDWSTFHQLSDEPISYSNGGEEIRNYEGSYKGPMSMQEALSSSRNTTALYTMQQVIASVGTGPLIQLMEDLNFDDELITNPSTGKSAFNEAYALGGGFNTSPLQMAGAYSVFANGGSYIQPHVISRIEFDDDNPYQEEYGKVYEIEYESKQIFEPSTAFMITQMLDPNLSTSIAGLANVPGMDLAIKTGTSTFGENGKGIPEDSARDRWVVGYSPNITTAVWSGYPENIESSENYISYHINVPEYVFKSIMSYANSLPDAYLHDDVFISQPSNVVSVQVVPNTWPPVESSSGETHYFIKDSADYNEVNKSVPLSTPTVTAKISDDGVDLKWNAIDGDNVSYNIYLDGELLTNTKETSYLLTYEALFSNKCKETYTVSVEAKNENEISYQYDVQIKNSNETCDLNTSQSNESNKDE